MHATSSVEFVIELLSTVGVSACELFEEDEGVCATEDPLAEAPAESPESLELLELLECEESADCEESEGCEESADCEESEDCAEDCRDTLSFCAGTDGAGLGTMRTLGE
jgi:hypothetical protein